MIHAGDFVIIRGNTFTPNPHGFKNGAIVEVLDTNVYNFMDPNQPYCKVKGDTNFMGELNRDKTQYVIYRDLQELR